MVLDSVKDDAGTEKLVAALSTRLDSRLFEPHVCCFEGSPRLADLGRYLHTALFPLNRVYSPAGLLTIWRFRQYLEQNQIDVVHSFMTRADIVGVLAALGLRRVVVVTSRLNAGYWYTPGYKRLFRILNRFTTQVVTNSAYAKQVVSAAEKLPLHKITVLYTGVDLAQYSSSSGDLSVPASLGIPTDAQVVGVVANYRAVKDLPLFLRAAQITAAAAPRTAFVLVGQGELKPDLEKLALGLGIRDRVFFSDGRGSVPDYLARMSVACLSSLSEGLPNAILEYMAAGLPVVATDVGGNPELVADGATGYLVRERTAEALAEPIIRLLRDDALRSAMGNKGLERARSEFDLSAAVRRLESFYLSAAGKAGIAVGAQCCD